MWQGVMASTGLVVAVWARLQTPPRPVQFRLSAPRVAVEPGKAATLWLRATVERDWHLYAFAMPSGGAAATRVTVLEPWAALVTPLRAPAPDTIPDPAFDTFSPAYHDSVSVPMDVRVGGSVRPGPRLVRVAVRFQACTRRVCLPPRTDTLSTLLQIGKGGMP